jgi:hypothetical protein
MEIGPSQEGNNVAGKKVGQVDSPSSIPSISHGGEPDGMWTASLPLLSLIVLSESTETPAVPGHIQGALSPDQSGPNAANKWEANPRDPSPSPPAPSISHSGESGGTTQVGRRRDRRSESGNNREKGVDDAEGSEHSQRNSRLHPEVGDVESGPSRDENNVSREEVCQANSPMSTPSIPHSGKPNGM